MYATAARFTAAIARQPVVATAGLKTSAVRSIAATTTLRSADGRLYSKNR